MKLSVLPILSLVILLSSCSHSSDKNFVAKVDSPMAFYRLQKNGPPTYDKVFRRVDKLLKFIAKDSVTQKKEWTWDTLWMVKVVVDTLRDTHHKPIYDSVHKAYLPQYQWQQLIDNHYIQPSTIEPLP